MPHKEQEKLSVGEKKDTYKEQKEKPTRYKKKNL